MPKKQLEYILQKQVCAYLNSNYPDVLFMSDTIASVKLTMQQAVRNKAIQKEGFKTPDLIIFEPKGKYHGLFIELKNKSPFKKNGVDLLQNEHIQAQATTMEELLKKGYLCYFCWGLDTAIRIIDKYMKL